MNRLCKGCLPLLLVATFSGQAQASSQALNPLDLIQQACTLTRTRWICDISESVVMLQSLAQNGWDRVQSSALAFGQGWLQDAAMTAGQAVCFEIPQIGLQKTCLADLTAKTKQWLLTEPDKLFTNLFEQGQNFYLSNLLQKFSGTSTAQPYSPTFFADGVIATQPNAKAKYFTAYAEDVQNLKKETEMGQIVTDSEQVIRPPDIKKGEVDPYLTHVGNLVMPGCAANASNCSAGWIAQQKSRATTAVSTREQLQGLIELQADAQGFEAQNTIELSKRLQKLAQLQVNTNKQLQMIYDGITREQKERQARYQASLEQEMSKAYTTGQQAAANFSSASQIMLNNANPNSVLDAVLRY